MPRPSPPTLAALPALPGLADRAGLLPGQQLLIYTPDGPLGGTFVCVQCRAQAWQPDLLAHAPGCPARPAGGPDLTPSEPR